MPPLSRKAPKRLESGLTKDRAYALAQKLGAKAVTAAVKSARAAGARTPEEIDQFLHDNPPTAYMVHHDRIPPPPAVTDDWDGEAWAEFEAGDWEVTEYTHEPRYVVEHPDANDGWVIAYGDPAAALRHRDELRKRHRSKRRRIHVRHREKGHHIDWAPKR